MTCFPHISFYLNLGYPTSAHLITSPLFSSPNFSSPHLISPCLSPHFAFPLPHVSHRISSHHFTFSPHLFLTNLTSHVTSPITSPHLLSSSSLLCSPQLLTLPLHNAPHFSHDLTSRHSLYRLTHLVWDSITPRYLFSVQLPIPFIINLCNFYWISVVCLVSAMVAAIVSGFGLLFLLLLLFLSMALVYRYLGWAEQTSSQLHTLSIWPFLSHRVWDCFWWLCFGVCEVHYVAKHNITLHQVI